MSLALGDSHIAIILSTTSRLSRRRPRDGARLPGAGLRPCRENRRTGQMTDPSLRPFSSRAWRLVQSFITPEKSPLACDFVPRMRLRHGCCCGIGAWRRRFRPGFEKRLMAIASRMAKNMPISALLSVSEREANHPTLVPFDGNAAPRCGAADWRECRAISGTTGRRAAHKVPTQGHGEMRWEFDCDELWIAALPCETACLCGETSYDYGFVKNRDNADMPNCFSPLERSNPVE